jgi:SAM-dependent methyltransferase
MATKVDEWFQANRENWDERVGVHLAAPDYDLAELRAGDGRLDPLVERQLGDVAELKVLHPQCHFGRDSLILAQRGADVTGLDFSGEAIRVARALASECGLSARFVEGNVYDAPTLITEPGSFDLVFVTWGAICWLPDIASWAKVVATFLKPGGRLLLVEGHPCMSVFDDLMRQPNGMPNFLVPYFGRDPYVDETGTTYVGTGAQLTTRNYSWIHPLSDVMSALLGTGLVIEAFEEHDAVPWQAFACLHKEPDGLYRFADRPWLPLSFSLVARQP